METEHIIIIGLLTVVILLLLTSNSEYVMGGKGCPAGTSKCPGRSTKCYSNTGSYATVAQNAFATCAPGSEHLGCPPGKKMSAADGRCY
jgi:hypothetical protein